MPPIDKDKRRAYNKQYQKTWYKNLSPERKKERSKYIHQSQTIRVHITKERLIEEMGGICLECKQHFPSKVYDFHHNNGEKTRGISTMLANGCSYELIKIEALKCELLCANCHRLKH